MRYLAFIFTFCVLALSVWPCCDDEATLRTPETQYCQTEDVPCDSEESPHTCSPFFHCSSCQAFALTSPAYLVQSTSLFQKESSYPELPISPVIVFAGDIWQPPQLV
ncbi:DUF6660 family protein [Pedobacter caeni]|uniref:DUF6660 family protein n=1 Tax=Pedobacter caeni TaxID=288992 RepID=UPI0011612A40|nr:DUF6660 family protein [Pedobacter caeni]